MGVSRQVLDLQDVFIKNELPIGENNCVNLHYETLHPFLPNTLEVFIDGVRKEPLIDYTVGLDFQSFDLLVVPLSSHEAVRVNYIQDC